MTLISGSTGKHNAQIRNGAPFDVFFAADAIRPERLERDGLTVVGTRTTYAVGRLVLWSARPRYVDAGGEVLRGDDFRHLAIANPKLAPYGRAAEEVLRAFGVWEEVSGRLVRGENVAQTLHFIQSGNAELGFVAYSQLRAMGQQADGSSWEIPRELYSPIEQQVVLLKDTSDARALLAFVQSEEARKIISDFGYALPPGRQEKNTGVRHDAR